MSRPDIDNLIAEVFALTGVKLTADDPIVAVLLLQRQSVQTAMQAFEQRQQDGSKEYECIKCTLIASMQGYNPPTAIEFGRKVLYSTERPGFLELEEHVKRK